MRVLAIDPRLHPASAGEAEDGQKMRGKAPIDDQVAANAEAIPTGVAERNSMRTSAGAAPKVDGRGKRSDSGTTLDGDTSGSC